MPPKKKSLNDKKEEAREREETKKKTAKDSKDKADADAYWAAAGDGQNKSVQKKEEEERKRQEQAAKRAELKRLQEEEEAALSKAKSKLAPAGSQKVTKYQLDKQREIEEQLKQEALKERSMALKREVDEDSYHRMVVQENINRVDEDAVHARTIEHAVAALTVGDAVPEDKHPEKRMKASWKAFEERMLIELKQDKPGLKMSQYKDMIWKLWQKSPDNPLNQVAAAAAAVAGPSR